MSFTGQQIIDRALTKANDESAAYWGATESLRNVNDAQRAIVRLLHKAGATAAQPTLVNASSRQTMSGLSLTRGIAFLDVVCNVSGSTRGTPIRRVSRAWLDDEVPAWHTTAGTPEYWVPDERDPLAFYLYPQPASGTNKAEVIYAAPPADLGSLAGTFGLDDIYAESAEWYCLFAMFSKDITKLKSAQYAAQYWALFKESLGLGDAAIGRAKAEGQAKEQGA